MPTIQIQRANFYYELYGDSRKPKLVLVAGYSRSATIWAALLPYLVDHFHVLVFDNLAVGQTTDDYDDLLPTLVVAHVAQLMQELGFAPAWLLGHSMGGSIAMQLAVDHCRCVSGLFVVGSTLRWSQRTIWVLGELNNFIESGMGVEDQLRFSIPWGFSEKAIADKKLLPTLLAMETSYPFPQTLVDKRRQHRLLAAFDLRESAADIECPVVVVSGSEDVIATCCEGASIVAGISGAQYHEFATAHAIPGEEAEQLSRLIVTNALS